ncbi:MAG: PLP-dependent aminotransferase family protein [Anaerolineae bacterium]|nr:PLP-dependent aminotransferase family protein [Anaerolineae bacterium]MDW8067875.1 PLP-dependent aminotransferase family protein [Anaerolineae bacterium]
MQPVIAFTRGIPAPESFPKAKLAECATTVLREHGDEVLQYAPARGFRPLRAHIAAEAGVHEDQVILGQGSLQLLDLLARMLIRPGDIACTEEPSYDRAITILRRAGARVVGIPLQDDGPDVEVLEERLRSGERPVLFYLVPDFQNPSGSVMAVQKRQRVAQLAREYGFLVVEDLPYRRLRYRGTDLPTLRDFAPERVIQMSSYSKLISPGLRVGYIIVPPDLAGPLAKMAEDTYINASYLNQAMVDEFIRRGWLEPHLEFLKELYRPRLDAILGALEEYLGGRATWHRPDGGFFVGLYLSGPVQAEALLQRAQEAGLRLTDGRGFFANGGGDHFIRLPFCALTPEEIHEGIRRLAMVVR